MLFRILLVLYIVLVILSCFGWDVQYYDEPITLVQGRLVAQGLRPHVDFWSYYPPLTYYLNAAAFMLFGKTVLAQRFLQIVFYIAVLFVSERFLRFSLPDAAFATCSTLLLAVSVGPETLLPAQIGFSISLLALFTHFSSYGSPAIQVKRQAAAGLVAGLGILSRVNFGVYASAVILLDLLLLWLLPLVDRRFDDLRSLRDWKTLGAFLVSLLVSCVVVYTLLCGPNLGLGFRQAVVFPNQQAMGLRFIPLQMSPGLVYAILFPCMWFCVRVLVGANEIALKSFLPVLVGMTLIGLAWFRHASPHVARDIACLEIVSVLLLQTFFCRLKREELSLLLFFSCMLHYYLTRADIWHWPLLLPTAALIVPYLFLYPIRVDEAFAIPTIRPGAGIALLVFLMCIIWSIPELRPARLRNGLSMILHGQIFSRVSDSERVTARTTPPRPWAELYNDSDELNAVRFVRDRTSPKDYVFVTADDQAEPFSNDVRAYWLLDRPIGANYFIFDPDLTRQPRIQTAMIRDLQRNRVRWIILEHDPPMDESFRQHKRNGSKLLDEFTTANFTEVARFGRFGILKSRTF